MKEMEIRANGKRFADKRRVLVTISYINEDDTLEELVREECDGAYAFLFRGWNEEYAGYTSSTMAGVKVGDRDLAASIISNKLLKGAAEMIAEALEARKVKLSFPRRKH